VREKYSKTQNTQKKTNLNTNKLAPVKKNMQNTQKLNLNRN